MKREGHYPYKDSQGNYYLEEKEEKCIDPYYNPQSSQKEKKQEVVRRKNINRIREAPQQIVKTGMAVRARVKEYEKKCEESGKWPYEQKKQVQCPQLIKDKEKSNTLKAEQAMNKIKVQSKRELKDMVSQSKLLVQKAQNRLNRINCSQTSKIEKENPSKIQSTCEQIKAQAPPRKTKYRKPQPKLRDDICEKPQKPQGIQKKEQKVELLPCSFCSTQMSLDDMTEHHKHCEMAYQCKKCQDFFPIYLAEDHQSVCTSNKQKGTKKETKQKKYKQQKFFKPNQYQIQQYFEEMKNRMPQVDDEQIMALILYDIEQQQAEARSKGIPIETSKYVPPQELEDDTHQEYIYADNNNMYEDEDNIYGQESPFHFKEEPKQKGLTKKQINRLMTDKYKRGEDQSEIDCAICSKQKEQGDEVIRLPCFHTYHSECIIPWLQMKPLCPTCKHNLKSK